MVRPQKSNLGIRMGISSLRSRAWELILPALFLMRRHCDRNQTHIMSEPQKTEPDLELEFLPAWAKEDSNTKKYDHIRGDEEARPRRGRGPRREGGGGSRGDQRAPRRSGPYDRDQNRGRGDGQNRGRGEGRGRGRDQRRGGGRDQRGRPGRGRRDDRRDRPPEQLPEIEVRICPEPNGLDAMARQIRVSGRAYPVFDIARLVMKAPDRYLVEFAVRRKEKQVLQPLFVCQLDDTLWLSEDAAMQHVLRKHFDTFYATEKTAIDPPKGTYTFVAQCGMSGVILGPPNYHDYQKKLVALHLERFAKMPFDRFKSRVNIVRDEEVVKKWIEDQSFKTEFSALNVSEEVKFANREEVAAHFKQTHLPNIVKSVESHKIAGKDAGMAADHKLRQMARYLIDDQRRFPLKVVNVLCEEFAKHQLQFFKKDKTVTHVSVSRPHFLDLDSTPVSDSIKSIVKFIDDTEKCTRRKIYDALAPQAVIEVKPPEPEAPAAEAAEAKPEEANTEEKAEATTEAEQPSENAAEATPKEEAPKADAAPAEPELTPEQQAINADLHWLIHEGHVIEFSNAVVETAKKPRPRPEQQPKKKKKKGKQRRPRMAPVFVDTAPMLI